jgi:type IV pilus assembly protein PilA
LVVIIIIGILAAIALPSFLNQANKARQSEAKTYTGSVNRAQQAYYLENREFAENLPDLGIGIAEETDNYTYTVVVAGTEAEIQAAAFDGATDLYTYTGLTWVDTSTPEAATTRAKICESDEPQANAPACDPD